MHFVKHSKNYSHFSLPLKEPQQYEEYSSDYERYFEPAIVMEGRWTCAREVVDRVPVAEFVAPEMKDADSSKHGANEEITFATHNLEIPNRSLSERFESVEDGILDHHHDSRPDRMPFIHNRILP